VQAVARQRGREADAFVVAADALKRCGGLQTDAAAARAVVAACALDAAAAAALVAAAAPGVRAAVADEVGRGRE